MNPAREVKTDKLLPTEVSEGASSFVKSWNELMAVIVSKSAALHNAASR
jgi:hypothetical protein